MHASSKTGCTFTLFNSKKKFYILENEDYSLKDGWLKIIKLREIINKYDYVFMSDADVIITNNNIKIEDLILKYELKNNIMLVTTDYNSLNTGNIIWKKSNETIEFLDNIINIGNDNIRFSLNNPFKVIGIYEQPSIIYLLNSNVELRNKIKIVPQYELNSYLDHFSTNNKSNIVKIINNKNNRCTWKPNDFLIHFAGIDHNKINIDNIIKKYVSLYKLYIIRREGIDYGNIY